MIGSFPALTHNSTLWQQFPSLFGCISQSWNLPRGEQQLENESWGFKSAIPSIIQGLAFYERVSERS